MKKTIFSTLCAATILLSAASAPTFAANAKDEVAADNYRSTHYGATTYGTYGTDGGSTINRTNDYNATTNGTSRMNSNTFGTTGTRGTGNYGVTNQMSSYSTNGTGTTMNGNYRSLANNTADDDFDWGWLGLLGLAGLFGLRSRDRERT
ncbi:WGxxGxxG-CTERM domain-containing protein [Paenibacillus glycanilyticus]|uniref:WGxxGxxG family protein n=1 Tax=Paenibacillus glycanilyticus TaxID=126569 RepID=UPI002040A314|nr:WGxxGxxG family protein [Paenibacillus glycanilyticus]MCM3627906.1 WGxxGxxG-CTERM domain-containing protein [Paenibacillus glycanilyticus]